MEGKVVYQGKSKGGTDFIIKYPTMDDAQAMTDYINTLSDERTFITYQGDHENLDSEAKWLEDQIKGIKGHTVVHFVVIIDNKLVGDAAISLQKRTSSHEGVLGISLLKNFRNEGIGKILLQLILEEAKKELSSLKIVSLAVFGNNPVAMNLYENFGFKEYGRLPEGLLYKGEYVDHVYMYKKV